MAMGAPLHIAGVPKVEKLRSRSGINNSYKTIDPDTKGIIGLGRPVSIILGLLPHFSEDFKIVIWKNC
jgi:hypothetical protein